MDLPAFRLVSRTYEKASWPIVVHVFYGVSPEQVQGYYQAHLKSDRFLSGCKNGAFMQMPCREEHQIDERVRGNKWRRVG